MGTALHAFQTGEVDGALSLGPLECMPNKIAESHFQRAAIDLGIPTLTLAVNGEPLDDQALQSFVYDVFEHEACRHPPPVRARQANAVRVPARGMVGFALSLLPVLPFEPYPPSGSLCPGRNAVGPTRSDGGTAPRSE